MSLSTDELPTVIFSRNVEVAHVVTARRIQQVIQLRLEWSQRRQVQRQRLLKLFASGLLL